MRVPPADVVKSNVTALVRAARVLDMPVVLTSSSEEYQGVLLPELEEIAPEAYAARIRRHGTVNAFDDPGFAAAVKGIGRSNLIMAGIGSEVCGVWPAVGARREGYDVQFVADACGTDTETGHQITLRRLESEGISLTTTAMLISELAGDLSTPQGTELLQIMLAR